MCWWADFHVFSHLYAKLSWLQLYSYCSDITALPIKLLAMTEIEEFTKCQNIPLDKEDIF